jgi:hypothetical protein
VTVAAAVVGAAVVVEVVGVGNAALVVTTLEVAAGPVVAATEGVVLPEVVVAPLVLLPTVAVGTTETWVRLLLLSTRTSKVITIITRARIPSMDNHSPVFFCGGGAWGALGA